MLAQRALAAPWTSTGTVMVYDGLGFPYMQALSGYPAATRPTVGNSLFTARVRIGGTYSGVYLMTDNEPVTTDNTWSQTQLYLYAGSGTGSVNFIVYGGGTSLFTAAAAINFLDWYDLKITTDGSTESAYYKLATANTWTLLGTSPDFTAQDMNYVGVEMWGSGLVRNVTAGADGPPPLSPTNLNAHITLADFPNDPAKLAMIAVKIQLAQNGSPLATEVVFPTSNPFTHTFPNLAAGSYDVTVRASKCLTKVATGQVVTINNTPDVNFTLVNGDLDGDNEITTTDLSVLLSNLGLKGD